MKLIKFVLWLIIIGLIAALVTLVLQNLEYFKAATALGLDLKVVETWKWELPALATGYYFLICFAVGLLLTGYKAVCIKHRLNKVVKSQDKEITRLKDKVNTLKTQLEVFTHDPYIKKALAREKEEKIKALPVDTETQPDLSIDDNKEE